MHAPAITQVLLVAELEELQANPARAARGTVLVGVGVARPATQQHGWGASGACVLRSRAVGAWQGNLVQGCRLCRAGALTSNCLSLPPPLPPARHAPQEASLDKKQGAICSLLVQAGTLRIGDAVQAGSAYGKASLLGRRGRLACGHRGSRGSHGGCCLVSRLVAWPLRTCVQLSHAGCALPRCRRRCARCAACRATQMRRAPAWRCRRAGRGRGVQAAGGAVQPALGDVPCTPASGHVFMRHAPCPAQARN